MAISGCILFGFVIAHLAGNLQIFLGPEIINRYGQFLQTTPELLWPARIGLIVLVVVHVAASAQLSVENKRARAVPYAHYEVVAASYASRTMLMSGLIIAAFVIYHLLHFTVQIPGINFTGRDFRILEDAKSRHDIYAMMVIGFKQPLVSGFYILGMALLCLHLSHGVASMFQSMGWKNKYYGKFIDRVAMLVAILIFVGYCSIPLAALIGALKLP
jgi:succinate dehydrogenase / fumarate reductase cytochrome b subunit